ncbi:MAG: MBL fold metallo-hydrolase [Christensenellaceae bacterium]|nr:MBL fold metallo-hydrolase [Christensenellaceae bacterium]
MSLDISPLFSSSSGNCTYIEAQGTGILIDAGVAGGVAAAALSEIGKSPADVAGILVTHEHVDHIRAVGVLSRKYDIPVYANEGTWLAMEGKIGNIALKNTRIIEKSEFYIGSLCVQPVPIHHDAADPTGYAVYGAGRKVGVMTDTGHVTAAMLDAMEGADILLLESNHDVDMLKNGRYPYKLKQRILSGKGHLSNDAAAEAAIALAGRGVRGILLAHLSKDNNREELAYGAVRSALQQRGLLVGRDISLGTAQKHKVTGYYSLK